MLHFEPLTLERKNELLPLYHANNRDSCQHSFVSSFCMRGKYGDQVAVEDGVLYTLRAHCQRPYERVYLFPLCDLDDDETVLRAVEAVLADAHGNGCAVSFETIVEPAAEALRRLFPGLFEIEEKRDYAEYLYTKEKLAFLAGHEMASKRHDLSTFERDYGGRYEVRPIRTPEQIEQIRQFQAWWKTEKQLREEDVQLELEDAAIRIGLEHFFELGLSGILVTIDGAIAGYTYGAPLSDTCYDVMIEKGDRRMTDIYKILNRDLVRQCCAGMTYINREEDLGVPGLRKAKLSYKPDRLLRKFVAKEVRMA